LDDELAESGDEGLFTDEESDEEDESGDDTVDDDGPLRLSVR
jgi:hypothetical protein